MTAVNGMTEPWLSVIVPTTGRDTLERTIKSVRDQKDERSVELIVVADTHAGTFWRNLSAIEKICEQYRAIYLEHDGGSHCYGQQQRNHGMRYAHEHSPAKWLSFLQDDDIYTPGAFGMIARAVDCELDGDTLLPFLFRCYLHHGGRAVWFDRQILIGNVDANCIVVPNLAERCGRWGERYLGDFDFISETVTQKNGNDVIWMTDVIAEARPA